MIDHYGELGPEDAGTEQNDEQSDDGAQAHTLADEALRNEPALHSPTESKRKGSRLNEDSTQDLIDHMRDMESSGRIDMSAFDGEPNHDDNAGKFGKGHDDDGFENDDS
ncbi:MAG: hypothetical protein ABIT10_12870 [Alteraurantiacibacter sp.]